MKKKHLFDLLLCLLLFQSGCIMYPDKGLARYGVEGRLTSEDNKTPISNEHILVTINGQAFKRKTDKQGKFRVRPDYDRYITWTMCGPILVASCPSIEIAVERYENFVIEKDLERPEYNCMDINEVNYVKDGYIFLGDVQMKKQ